MSHFNRNLVLLGAFLHDIGKIYQRTGLPPVVGYEQFSKEELGSSGLHNRWTGSFFSEYVPEPFLGAGSLAFYHHKPPDVFHQIVATADHIASSERLEGPKVSPSEELLAPVAQRIYLPEDENAGPRYQSLVEYRYPLKSLSVANRLDFMPDRKEELLKASPLKEAYQTLWNKFKEDLEKLRTVVNFDTYVFALYFLIKKHLIRVPSATYGSYPDISFFDHGRSAAAIADCLYVYHQETNSLTTEAVTENRTLSKFLLIGGDVSGIQNYIYNMIVPQEEAKGVSKRLRGRSFYLQLLTETLVDYLLTQLDLKIVHQLWCSGGHFMLIAPNIPVIQSRLKEATQEIEHYLLREFHGELGIVISSVEVTGEQLGYRFSEVLKKVQNKLYEQKKRKFSEVIKSEDQVHFVSEPAQLQGNPVGDTPPDAHTIQRNKRDHDLGDKISRWDQDWWLVKYLFQGRVVPEDSLACFSLRSVEGKPPYQIYWMVQKEPSLEADTAYLVNPTGRFQQIGTVKCGFKYIANYLSQYENQQEVSCRNYRERRYQSERPVTPVKIGDFKDFDDFAEASAGGFLGVLRMDVDHLGAIFSFGISEQRSISRIAALSTDIELFFTGYLNTLCSQSVAKEIQIGNKARMETVHKYQNISVIYSGGDDLFIVGAWNEVLDLAIEIYREFKAFTCKNADIHISGGIGICKPKYPIHRAAQQAKILLDDIAKENRNRESPVRNGSNRNRSNSKRNALALFNHRITWKDLLEGEERLPGGLKEFGDYLIKAIDQREINRTYLYKLLELWGEWKERGVMKLARFFYLTVRNIDNKMVRGRLIQILPRYLNTPLIPILVSYVGLKTRRRKEDE
jgi:CRISPR-associated protein Csm1